MKASTAVWHPAYIAIGSNLQDPRAQVLSAFGRLERLPKTRLVLRSRLYRTRPVGPAPQPEFVNAVAGVLTQLDSLTLLRDLRAIEAAAGRPALHEKWGPRVLDLDLLVFGRERRDEPELTLPHPRMAERNFVLYPLADIAADLDVPGLGRVADLARRVTSEGIRPIDAD